jgi:predicted methyltransferase
LKKQLLFAAISTLALAACQQDTPPAQPTATAVEVKSHRSAQNSARDVYRHPTQTLAFFDIQATDTVIEILPGSGWYTEILAPKLKDKGTLITAHYPVFEGDTSYRSNSRLKFEEKLANNPAIYGNVKVVDFDVTSKSPDPLATQADAVLTFRSLHGFEDAGQLYNAFKQFSAMLKDGGTLGIVQHQAPEGSDPKAVAELGYLPPAHVVAVAASAGFSFKKASLINENDQDTIVQDNIAGGVWTLPPSSRGEHAEQYKDVGESNRMTIKFVKVGK